MFPQFPAHFPFISSQTFSTSMTMRVCPIDLWFQFDKFSKISILFFSKKASDNLNSVIFFPPPIDPQYKTVNCFPACYNLTSLCFIFSLKSRSPHSSSTKFFFKLKKKRTLSFEASFIITASFLSSLPLSFPFFYFFHFRLRQGRSQHSYLLIFFFFFKLANSRSLAHS